MYVMFFQVKDYGLEDSVMTVEELRMGVESQGTGKKALPSLLFSGCECDRIKKLLYFM